MVPLDSQGIPLQSRVTAGFPNTLTEDNQSQPCPLHTRERELSLPWADPPPPRDFWETVCWVHPAPASWTLHPVRFGRSRAGPAASQTAAPVHSPDPWAPGLHRQGHRVGTWLASRDHNRLVEAVRSHSALAVLMATVGGTGSSMFVRSQNPSTGLRCWLMGPAGGE